MSTKAFDPSRSSDTCTWKPEPPWSLNGLPMKVATSPLSTATSLTADFSMKARSAAFSAGASRRLISYWLLLNSWLTAKVSIPRLASVSVSLRTMPSGSACGPTV